MEGELLRGEGVVWKWNTLMALRINIWRKGCIWNCHVSPPPLPLENKHVTDWIHLQYEYYACVIHEMGIEHLHHKIIMPKCADHNGIATLQTGVCGLSHKSNYMYPRSIQQVLFMWVWRPIMFTRTSKYLWVDIYPCWVDFLTNLIAYEWIRWD